MSMHRRTFVKGAGLVAGLLPVGVSSALEVDAAGASSAAAASAAASSSPASGAAGIGEGWGRLRGQFDQDFSWRNFASFLLASRPKMVEDAIEYHRRQLNRNAPNYLPEVYRLEAESRALAGRYFGLGAENIAVTANTTMGLATLYNGISIRPDQEVLTTEHEHYSCVTSLHYRARREGFKINTIRLYEEPREASVGGMLERIRDNVTSRTRVLALTWVHSGSSIKLPVAEVSALVKDLNKGRDESDRLLFCLDGVHGFGVENTTFDELGCDYFVAGTHKWMFGPSGTGIMCSRDIQLARIAPTIPPFNLTGEAGFGAMMTPGGFHAFEHRAALGKAFEFHLQLGKEAVQNRIHQLNDYLKIRLEDLDGVELVTPLGSNLSAAFTFFRVGSRSPEEVAKILQEHRIIVSPADRDVPAVVRSSLGVLNSEDEIDALLTVLQKIA